MTRLYKCDKCGVVEEKEPVGIMVRYRQRNLVFELCVKCGEELVVSLHPGQSGYSSLFGSGRLMEKSTNNETL